MTLLLLLAACDASHLAFDPVPLDAGLSPMGGGSVDRRLAGCGWRVEVAMENGSLDAWYAEYDVFGRRVVLELDDEDVVTRRETTTYDAGGCPAALEIARRDDEGTNHLARFVQECDANGRVVRSRSDRDDTRYTLDYEGTELRAITTFDGDDAQTDRAELTWTDDRVTEWLELDPEGEVETTFGYTFGDDGWVRTRVEDGRVVERYSYDDQGRISTMEGRWNAAYEYPSALARFPTAGTWEGGTATYTVRCPR